ncbi:hypothetical protein V2154_10565 [Ewingella sp. CoE-038-23]|uniref:hypothetical protein n=1 Tax=Ewingella docleensis TaxID=3118588 RepID=UPI0033659D4A
MKQIQLAKLYKRGMFWGYGIAVEGELVGQQVESNIITEPNKLPIITASFYIKEQQAENPVTINLD